MTSASEPRQIGKYQVVKTLGGGGMAIVYDAYDPEVDRHVALKVMRDRYEGDESMAERFVQEAQRLASLEGHAAILPVYEVGRDGSFSYIAMRKIEGRSLADLIQRKGVLAIEQVRTILGRIGGALQFAHDRHLVHCDVKPSNILMDRSGKAYLTDFGIARALRDALRGTGDGPTGYTPRYASPEQVRGERVDERSDVFSLGVVLYEMCTGTVPWPDTDDPQALRLAICEGVIPSPRSRNPYIGDALERVLLHALERDPVRRFARPLDLVQALLGATLDGDPPVRTPEPKGPDATHPVGPALDDRAGTTPPVPTQRTRRRSRPHLVRRVAAFALVASLGVLAYAQRVALADWVDSLTVTTNDTDSHGPQDIEDPVEPTPPKPDDPTVARRTSYMVPLPHVDQAPPRIEPMTPEPVRVLLDYQRGARETRHALPATLHDLAERLRDEPWIRNALVREDPGDDVRSSDALARGEVDLVLHLQVDAYLRPGALSYLPETPVVRRVLWTWQWRDEPGPRSHSVDGDRAASSSADASPPSERLALRVRENARLGMDEVIEELRAHWRAFEREGHLVELCLDDVLGDRAMAYALESALLRCEALGPQDSFQILDDGRLTDEPWGSDGRPLHLERGSPVASRSEGDPPEVPTRSTLMLFSTDPSRAFDEASLERLRSELQDWNVVWQPYEEVPPAWFETISSFDGWRLVTPDDVPSRRRARSLRARLAGLGVGDALTAAKPWLVPCATADVDDGTFRLGLGSGPDPSASGTFDPEDGSASTRWRWRLSWRADLDALERLVAHVLQTSLGNAAHWRFERNGCRLRCVLSSS